ncbi:hypothetical protein SESBI_11317 [Sesbania bispinosa]|nr:hypothetical protein SESBI_11317 [Sesbania bispinosa]
MKATFLQLTVPQIKAEMEKTLQWLVPIAANTRKAHHGFGLVEEWVNSGSDVNRRPAGQTDLLRIKTLHHADKDKTEGYILELVFWLHHLVRQVRVGNGGIRSPVSTSPMLTIEDQQMLRDVGKRKLTPGINKSQEFDTAKNRLPSVPVIDFDIDRVKALDVIDGVETIGSSLSKSRGNAI